MKFLFSIILLFSSIGFSQTQKANDLSKIQTSLKEFKLQKKEMQLPDVSGIKKITEDGFKFVQTVLVKLYGSKEQIKQALKDYSSPQSPSSKTKAASLLASNYLRFSNPAFENLHDGLSNKSDFSADQLQKMEQAYQEIMAASEKIKSYAQKMNSDQIKYVSQDNPSPNIPRFLLWPLGTNKICTEEMVEKIRSEVGAEAYKRLASTMMLTGSSYEALYEPLYLHRIIEILKKDTSEDAQQILSQILSSLNPEQAEQSYNAFMKNINKGEEEFVSVLGPHVTKQDARIFYQGYARKYPLCLGILSSDYTRIKNRMK